MQTYILSIRSNQSGSDYFMIVSGNDISDAICRAWKTRYNATVISISQPYTDNEYVVEHTGRERIKYDQAGQTTETVYIDRIGEIKTIDALYTAEN